MKFPFIRALCVCVAAIGFVLRAETVPSVETAESAGLQPREMAAFERVTLEMSLKPFRVMEESAIRAVCAEAFRQWSPLIRRAKGSSILLWTADGSEILDYRGSLDDEIEWARYIGIGTPPKTTSKADPERRGLHSTPHLYMEKPPRITYRWLKTIVRCLKEVGETMTGKPVTVGATFDPGPEFANSVFKYQRHPEIALGNTMGSGRWVSCSARLKADAISYAGFPKGVPADTSIGTFLGRQSQHFLGDLGFDYLWLSNGFGFSLSAWDVKGVLFDGKKFNVRDAPRVRDEILSFWRDFRRECPRVPIETRGSNLSTGSDLATAASPIADIYRGGFGIVAPPNSPWAALDGDFGLEIVGYLSHIAELPPGERFPFRFYTHDPWWLNSPWFDRYGREPHDIYLPLAVARLGADARVTRPAFAEMLTIDNSFGEMPEQCPLEVIPHMLTAMDHYPDEPGLVTWIYPFDENHDLVFGPNPRPGEAFFGDWFMRGAVNAGLPLNTVVSTTNFSRSRKVNPDLYRQTVLVAPVPAAGSTLERDLIECVRDGHQILFYGPASHASAAMLELLNLKTAAPLAGEVELRGNLGGDSLKQGRIATRLNHRDALSGGLIDTVLRVPSAPGCEVCATVSDGMTERVYALTRENPLGHDSGRIAWVRGSFSCTIGGGHLPVPDNPEKLFPSAVMMRWMLARFGCVIRFDKPTPQTRDPLVLAARSNNGWYFSGYSPSTVTTLRLRFPHGAPVFTGSETWLENGFATCVMPRAWHREVRCFVEQEEDGEVSCVERHSGHVGISRRLWLRGLKNATVHFLPEARFVAKKIIMAVHDQRPHNEESIPFEREDDGRRLVVRGVTGDLLISW